jgi:CubicO group peptidase (beta-lactamase class C family)
VNRRSPSPLRRPRPQPLPRHAERRGLGAGNGRVRPDAQFALFPTIDVAGRTLGHGGRATAHVWADRDRRLSAACFLGGIGGRDVGRWQPEFAAAVYADLAEE